MKARFRLLSLPAGAIFFFLSCKDMPAQNHGPIRLGDSSTIVTENDPQKLQDLVTDLQPVIPPSVDDKDTTAPPKQADTIAAKDTKSVAAATEKKQPNGAGLSADFDDVSLFVQNLNAKQVGNKSLTHANGAVYIYTGGDVNGNMLKVTGNVTKVLQRYQVAVVLKNSMGTLPLETLSNTTDWAPMVGSNNTYRISGLDAKSLENPDANASEIRKAVAKAAQRRHYSRKKVEEWVSSVRNTRSVRQKPLYITLRSVMWKIDGKDSKGKAFSKQVRLDMPL